MFALYSPLGCALEGLRTLASHWRPSSGKQITPNSQCFAGTPWRFDFAITLGGNPVDLTDAGLWLTAKTSPVATAVVFQKTMGAGITVTAPASGIGLIQLIQLAPGDTSGLASRQVQLYFDLEVEVAGDVYTVATGRLMVDPDVTVRG